MGIIADEVTSASLNTIKPRSEHRRKTVTNFVTARTPYIVGTNHLPCKPIYHFFQSLWPGRYFGLSLGFIERDLIDGHMALHNTNLYGTFSQELFAGLLFPEFSRGFWLKCV